MKGGLRWSMMYEQALTICLGPKNHMLVLAGLHPPRAGAQHARAETLLSAQPSVEFTTLQPPSLGAALPKSH